VTVKEASKAFIKEWFPSSGIEHYVRSADVQGVKVMQVAAGVAQGCVAQGVGADARSDSRSG
jgi:hypothetical protein